MRFMKKSPRKPSSAKIGVSESQSKVEQIPSEAASKVRAWCGPGLGSQWRGARVSRLQR
jgi:hypothetical protein